MSAEKQWDATGPFLQFALQFDETTSQFDEKESNQRCSSARV